MPRALLRVACLVLGLLVSSWGLGVSFSAQAWAQGDRASAGDLFSEARALQNAGALDQAEVLYQELIPILARNNRRQDLAAVYHNLGSIAVRRGHYEAAKISYHEALRRRQEIQDQAGSADTYHNLGSIARTQEDLEAAKDFYERSIRLREPLADKKKIIVTYNALGVVILEREVQGAVGKVYWFFYKSLGWLDLFGSGKYITNLFAKLGIKEILDEAHALHERALALSQELDNRPGRAASYRNLGDIAQLQSNWEGAINFYEQSLAEYEALEDLEGIAGSYNNLGTVAAKRKDFFDAEIWYDQALALYESLDDTPGQLRVYAGLAIVAFQDRDYLGAAIRFYRVLHNALYNKFFGEQGFYPLA